ncbi:MAG: hypothetical protein E7624_06105 [Ruminococcaceae bacterium]|nr:hypothetical protein [Oscillospiraceae bacterium]
MRVDLLPRDGQFYRANMHTHSTLSDGEYTPEELKAHYKGEGYSVLALTEHGKYYDLRAELDDEDFITLPAYEANLNRDYDHTPFPALQKGPSLAPHQAETVHLNMFAIDPDKTTCEPDISDIKEKHSIENINEMIRRGKEAGFIVSYNHPHWSLNTASTYNNLEGLDAIEVINGACNRSSALDFAPHVMREMAWNGKRLVAVGGDDTHRPKHLFQGWTMFKAPELSHKAIIEALQKGNCYASSGPEIKELYVEDGVVHIKTSEAQGIYLATAGRRKASNLVAYDSDERVTEAEFLLDENDVFFHIIVKDMYGRPAATRIYYLDEADFGIPPKPAEETK